MFFFSTTTTNTPELREAVRGGGFGAVGGEGNGLHVVEVLNQHVQLRLGRQGSHGLLDAQLDGAHDLVGADL